MKDEIKEILNKFDKVLENYELDKKWGQMSVDSICHLFPNEMIIIKDYITNLQEENERLTQGVTLLTNKLIDMTKEKEDYKSRIDKAIEILKNEDYIDNLPYIDDEVSDKRKLDYWFEVADKLDDKRLEALEILGGKEND